MTALAFPKKTHGIAITKVSAPKATTVEKAETLTSWELETLCADLVVDGSNLSCGGAAELAFNQHSSPSLAAHGGY